MIAPNVRFSQGTRIRRKRLSPIPGKVLVRKGQYVQPTDSVVSAIYNPKHIIIELDRGLGLSHNRVAKYIHCQEGDLVSPGDILAGPVGLTRRVVRSTWVGRIVYCKEASVVIEMRTMPNFVQAGMPGIIQDLIEESGVVIETTGMIVQGVWGNGKIGSGKLQIDKKFLVNDLTKACIQENLNNQVLLASYCSEPDALIQAADASVGGIILVGMNPGLVSIANQQDFPILVINGFIKDEISAPIFEIFNKNSGQDACINAENSNRYRNTRPEVIFPFIKQGLEVSKDNQLLLFQPEDTVRTVSLLTGMRIGILKELSGPKKFPGGLVADSGLVEFSPDELSFVPLVNLEVVKG